MGVWTHSSDLIKRHALRDQYMESFVSRKRTREEVSSNGNRTSDITQDEEPTEMKLAILASLCPDKDTSTLLEVLLASNGSVEEAQRQLKRDSMPSSPRKKSALNSTVGYQSSLSTFTGSSNIPKSPRKLTRKGQTLHLYSPEDVAAHTPCSIIHNFLKAEDADALLRELLQESPTYTRDEFKLFDRTVTSPHTFCFYVDNWSDAEKQKTEYVYNGSHVADVRRTLPEMQKVSEIVEHDVNDEIQKRIKSHYPDGKKLKFQSPEPWVPNTSFVNCYDGGKESVGYHSDELTYLGPRAVIGSISLGVAREFRVRKVVPRNTHFDPDNTEARKANDARADTEGQISIHLPHNSLLVMHAEMQEEWKHSIAPAQAIDPHPISGNMRINITYRCYRKTMHPRYTPTCRCNIPCTLRCVQKQEANRGRYMWMCHAGYTPGQEG
ncbi:MAG: hypothetical protein M1831_005644 [Alyxoria varia]|nr:MAG: hypothetical protein M1831_005644 [Alyxoria varia]